MYSRRQQKPNMGVCGSGAWHMNTNRRGGGAPRRGRLGALLGAALFAIAGFSSTVAAQELTNLYTFTGSDGAYPIAGLLADAAGNLYGTTAGGGAGTSCIQGSGMIMGGAGNSTARPWPGYRSRPAG
jgi:hypothetical protein